MSDFLKVESATVGVILADPFPSIMLTQSITSSAIFGDDPTALHQFNGCGVHLTGERALLYGLLDDARLELSQLVDYRTVPKSLTTKYISNYLTTWYWVFGPSIEQDNMGGYTFIYAISVLGLDVSFVRRKFRSLIPKDHFITLLGPQFQNLPRWFVMDMHRELENLLGKNYARTFKRKLR